MGLVGGAVVKVLSEELLSCLHLGPQFIKAQGEALIDINTWEQSRFVAPVQTISDGHTSSIRISSD